MRRECAISAIILREELRKHGHAAIFNFQCMQRGNADNVIYKTIF
jgi:hypothetical protein